MRVGLRVKVKGMKVCVDCEHKDREKRIYGCDFARDETD